MTRERLDLAEAISFSIIFGVDPVIGPFTSFTMAVVVSVVGGCPAMITAATGAVAPVVAPLNRRHGFGHLLAAVVLGGVLQIAPWRRTRSPWRWWV